MRLIDADALKALVIQRHDFFRGCTNAPEKARRDELLQVMCDINEQPDVDAIPVEWLEQQFYDNPKSQWAEKCRDVYTKWQKWHRWQKEQEDEGCD